MKNALRRNAARRTVPGRPPFPSEWSREVESNHLQQAKEKNLRTPVPAYIMDRPLGAVHLCNPPICMSPEAGGNPLSTVLRFPSYRFASMVHRCPDRGRVTASKLFKPVGDRIWRCRWDLNPRADSSAYRFSGPTPSSSWVRHRIARIPPGADCVSRSSSC